MERAEGIVEAVARSGTSFKLEGDAGWFSAFRASQLNGLQKGDSVSFDYDVVNKGGKEFLNVKGNVDVEGASGGRTEPPARGRAAPPSRAAGGRAASAPARQSAAPADDPRQRSIVRQNSLTQANALYATLGRAGLLGEGVASELAVEIIEVARLFEAYSMVEDA